MAEEPKPKIVMTPGGSANENEAQFNEADVDWLPGVLRNVSDFTKHDVTKLPSITLWVSFPNGESKEIKDIPVEGQSNTTTLLSEDSIFKVKWSTPNAKHMDFTTLFSDSNRHLLTATFMGTKDAMNREIEAKKWTGTSNGFMDTKGSAKGWLNRGNSSDSLLQKAGKVFRDFQACTTTGPSSLTEALKNKAKLDATSGILSVQNVGDTNVGNAVIVMENGIFFFNANTKKTPIVIGAEGKVELEDLKVQKTKIETKQEVSGIKSKSIVTDDLLPTGTMFTPRLVKLPSLDALEFVIKIADIGKLMYDFFDAYNQVKR